MPRLNFPGNHGTTFDDWSKTLLERFRDAPLERVGDVIKAWQGEAVIAEFNFQTSEGYVEHSDNITQLHEMPQLPNYTEMMIDTRIKS